ncbi:hypothetical protein MUK42_10609 [Musa troglodytarum]|uniref:Uncharacterized protein n=1 Tax=Musa troglodytarum TaxID=320322 RepID=A0A9E7FEH8_9LILI|nr:hypothetical protein MUK42_10609 [Musa troglodytarum]
MSAARRPGLPTLRNAGINSHPHPPPSQRATIPL